MPERNNGQPPTNETPFHKIWGAVVEATQAQKDYRATQEASNTPVEPPTTNTDLTPKQVEALEGMDNLHKSLREKRVGEPTPDDDTLSDEMDAASKAYTEANPNDPTPVLTTEGTPVIPDKTTL